MKPVQCLRILAVILVTAKCCRAEAKVASKDNATTTETPMEVTPEFVTIQLNSSDVDSYVAAVESFLAATQVSEEKPDLSSSAIAGRSILDSIQFPVDDKCQAPEEGECVRVRQCSGLFSNRDEVKVLLCRFEGGAPLICCPNRWLSQNKDQLPDYQQANINGQDRRPPNGSPSRGGSPKLQQWQPINGFPPQIDNPNRQYKQPTNGKPSQGANPNRQYRPPANGFSSSGANPNRPFRQPTNSHPSSEFRPKKPAFIPVSCGISDGASRIVGGRESTPGAWPWMAAIFYKGEQSCGGALVSNKHVVTAAHCVVSDMFDSRYFLIRLGYHDIAKAQDLSKGRDVQVSRISEHANFDPATFKNDIAIMHLQEEVPFSTHIAPVCLPYNAVYSALAGDLAFVTGWGYTKFMGRRSDVLKEAYIRVWPEQECRRAFRQSFPITSEYICAGDGKGTQDSCQGDSGGPLVYQDGIKYYLVGVVSFGQRCGTPGYPGGYTRVTKYLQWLNDHF